VSLQKVSEHICSSSFIKKCLKNGEIEIANKLLGYPYFIDDVVIEGNKLATKIGFPTINIRNHFKILPKFGVYIVFVIVDGRRFNGVANLGIRPTIDQNGQQILEVHILNFSENLYGKRVKVKFIQFIREERKFETLDKLIKQIDNDVREAKNLFELLL
jgi:riboflavin kinase/FMN adenylyltransferase